MGRNSLWRLPKGWWWSRSAKAGSRSSALISALQPTSPVARIEEHVKANIRERYTLQSLADLVGMSTRHLSRHFVQEAEITPREFVLRARIDAARMVLESTDLPLKTVAFDCGFGTADRMRLVFRERLGVTPAEYRSSFQGQTMAEN